MKIKKIELKNWGPHKHLTLDMDASVVGIVGANGKGKSNLLQAIDYAFTANLNKQKAEKYIRNFGQHDGATSASVTIEFEKGGKKGIISRTVTSTVSKRKLEWDGESWNKAADVEKKLEDILGTDKASLANAVFIKQGELSNLVKGTPSERHTIFQKLMNLQFLEPRADDVQSKLSAIRGSLQDFRPLLQDITRDIEDVKEKLGDVGSADLVPAVNKYSEAIRDLSVLIGLHKQYMESIREADTINDSIKRITDSRYNVLAGHGVKSYEELQAAVDKLQADLEVYTNELNLLNKNAQAWNIKTNLRTLLSNTETGIAEAEKYVLNQDSLQSTTDVLNQMKKAVEYYDKLALLESEVAAAQSKLNLVSRDKRNAYENNKLLLENAIHKGEDSITKSKIKLHSIDIKILALQSETECPVCGSSISSETLRLPGETDEQLVHRLGQEWNEAEAGIRAAEAAVADNTHTLRIMESEAIAEGLHEAQSKDVLNKHLKALEDFKSSTATPTVIRQAAVQTAEILQTTLANHEKYFVSLSQLQNSRIDLQTQLSSMEDVECPDESKKTKLSNTISNTRYNLQLRTGGIRTLDSLNGQLSAIYEQQRNNLQKTAELDKAILTFWDEPREALESLWGFAQSQEECVYDRNSVAHCEQVLSIFEGERASIKETITRKQLEEGQLAKLQAKLEDVKGLILQNDDKQRLIDDLQIVKSMLMRNGVPLAFMNDVFGKITGMIQEMLNRMGANFNVIPDPDRPCSFLFVRNDNNTGFEMSQEQLSGGQAIRLALALLLSCQQVILPDVGLLVLDEPSSHIDSEGVENMRDLFLSLQDILNNSDMQVIMVDHNEKLMTAFDKTIELK